MTKKKTQKKPGAFPAQVREILLGFVGRKFKDERELAKHAARANQELLNVAHANNKKIAAVKKKLQTAKGAQKKALREKLESLVAENLTVTAAVRLLSSQVLTKQFDIMTRRWDISFPQWKLPR